MATGALSTALHLVHWEILSLITLALTAALWLLLAAAFTRRLRHDPQRWHREALTLPSLSGVAATDVLGTRLSALGLHYVALALLVPALVLWLYLVPGVIRHWPHKVPGAAYLVTVSTQSLTVIIASLAVALRAPWPLWAATGLFLLGLGLYCLVLVRFDFVQLRTGAGDHWVVCGAVSISALAASRLASAADPHGSLRWASGGYGVVRTVTLALLGVALVWYLILLYYEVRHPRPRYDLRRWSTVFPLAMTALASLDSAVSLHIRALHALGWVLLWPALAAWVAVSAGFLRGRRPTVPR